MRSIGLVQRSIPDDPRVVNVDGGRREGASLIKRDLNILTFRNLGFAHGTLNFGLGLRSFLGLGVVGVLGLVVAGIACLGRYSLARFGPFAFRRNLTVRSIAGRLRGRPLSRPGGCGCRVAILRGRRLGGIRLCRVTLGSGRRRVVLLRSPGAVLFAVEQPLQADNVDTESLGFCHLGGRLVVVRLRGDEMGCVVGHCAAHGGPERLCLALDERMRSTGKCPAECELAAIKDRRRRTGGSLFAPLGRHFAFSRGCL